MISFLSKAKIFLGDCISTPWSINGVAREDLNDWKSKNIWQAAGKLSYLEKEFLFYREHPIRISISLASLLLLAIAWVKIPVLPDSWIVAQWIGWDEGAQISYFSTLWSVQATLAALVYPIVIAFVTVFLQKRSAAGAFLRIYLLDSAALLCGFSALSLVVVMAVQYVLLSTYGTDSLILWTSLDSAWFLFNAALTASFLYRTIEFLRPDIQNKVLNRYVLNVAIPREIERLYTYHLMKVSLERKWLPGDDYYATDSGNKQTPSVTVHGLLFNDGQNQVTVFLNKSSRLIDIRLWVMRFVISIWIEKAKNWVKPEGAAQERRSVFSINVSPSNLYSGEVVLAQVANGPNLKTLYQKVLRLSLKFEPVSKAHNEISSASVIAHLADITKASVESNSDTDFEDSLFALMDFHAKLLNATTTSDKDGNDDSVALLPTTDNFFSRRLHETWSEMYRPIMEAAISLIEEDASHVRRLCYLGGNLNHKLSEVQPFQIRRDILRLPTVLMYLLSQWWLKKAAEQEKIPPGYPSGIELEHVAKRTYEGTIHAFVGAWESALGALPSMKSATAWAQVKYAAQGQEAHLIETVRIIVRAVQRGDTLVSKCMLDVFIKWRGLNDIDDPFLRYSDKEEFITYEILIKRKWDDIFNDLKFSVSRQNDSTSIALQQSIASIVVNNLWEDTRLLLAAMLLGRVDKYIKVGLSEHSFAATLFIGLLTNQEWLPGNSLIYNRKSINPEETLTALVRIGFADTSQNYFQRIAQAFERAGDDDDMPISGRTYSSRSYTGIEEYENYFIALLIILSQQNWSPSRALINQCDIWIANEQQTVVNLLYRLDKWIQNIDDVDWYSYATVERMISQLGKSHTLEEGKRRVKDALEKIKKHLIGQRDEALSNANISDARLNQIATYASHSGFGNEGPFPMAFFKCEYVPDVLDEALFNYVQVPKSDLTDEEFEQRAINEDDYWDEMCSSFVAQTTFLDALKHVLLTSISVDSGESYWEVLKAETQRIKESGGTPILVLENGTRPEWVWQWQYPSSVDGEYKRPDDLSVTFQPEQSKGYYCHFNDIEVYVSHAFPLASGESFVLDKRCFGTVKFTEYSEGRFVDIQAETRSDNELLCDLQIKFARKVEPTESLGTKIVSIEKNLIE